ncbi:HepT-like ribonuclease domain-containing protein [Frankia sp. CcWB3]
MPWRSVTGFRNIAVHTYFEVDWSIVWRIHAGSHTFCSGRRGLTARIAQRGHLLQLVLRSSHRWTYALRRHLPSLQPGAIPTPPSHPHP